MRALILPSFLTSWGFNYRVAGSDQENTCKSGLVYGPGDAWKAVKTLFKSYLWEGHGCFCVVERQIWKLNST